MSSPATLADIARDADLMMWCNGCNHHVTVPIAAAIARFAPRRTVPSIRGRCGNCGSVDVDVRPDWRAKGPPIARH